MSGKCSACDSTDLRIKRDNGGPYGMNNLPIGKGKPVAMDSLVCLGCGHVEFSVGDEKALARIADMWERP